MKRLALLRVVDDFPVAAVESMRKKTKKHKNPREQKRGSRALVMPAERASLGETPRQLKGTGTGIRPQEKARITARDIEAARHLLPRELPQQQPCSTFQSNQDDQDCRSHLPDDRHTRRQTRTSMQLHSNCQRFSASSLERHYMN